MYIDTRSAKLGNRVFNMASPGKFTDSQLIAACQDGDQKAFRYLMKKYERLVQAWIVQLWPDWQDKSDLVQEVFIKVWRSIGSLRKSAAFKMWLRQLVTNMVYDELRQRARRVVISIDTASADADEQAFAIQIADHSCVPDKLYERGELACAICTAIVGLPDEFRIAVVLREMGGLPYAEIAELTSTGVGTVKSRISRARKKVQELLQPYLNAA